MPDDPQGSAAGASSSAVQPYLILGAAAVSIISVLGYMVLVALVILHQGEWTQFQQVQIAGAISFLAGTCVGTVVSYWVGSSAGSMAKNAMMLRREDSRP